MLNLSFIKTKEARLGAILVLAIIIVIVAINLIKGSKPNVEIREVKSQNKLGVVENISKSRNSNKYIITIVFEKGINNEMSLAEGKADTVTITVEEHLLESVLKNYEIPESKVNIDQIISTQKLETKTPTASQSNVMAPEKHLQKKPVPMPDISPSSILFKVQFFMSKHHIPVNDQRFKGLNNVSYYESDNHFKYTAGETNNFSEILKIHKTIINDYPEAFIVAFADNKRIPVTDAKKVLRNSQK